MPYSVKRIVICAAVLISAAFVPTGCSRNEDKPQGGETNAASPAAEVAAERAKLPPDERALVDDQEWCVVTTDERLGSMGPPLKLDIKGRPVFVCCKGCKRKAEADPDGTLAKVEELKAKARAERDAKK